MILRRAVPLLLPALLLLGGCEKAKEVAGGVTPKKVPPATGEATNGTETAPDGPKFTGEIALAAQSARVPVIMYHDIIARRGRGSVWFDCSAEEFEAQMAKIVELGLTPISVQELYDHLAEGKDVPARAIVLTFDDNYQGFYDNAWPILKRYNFPAMMFVHTNYVGDKKGPHPKMSWDRLKELEKDPLFTVGGHTSSHFLDLAVRPPEVQRSELEASKAKLESHLGHKIDFLAYPNGSNSPITREMTKQAGYKMAFTIVNTPAEESPGIFAVGRYVHTRLEKAVADADSAALNAPAAVSRTPFVDAPVSYEVFDDGEIKVSLVRGGRPMSMMSTGRDGVRDFVKKGKGVAGINGGFFAMAAIKSTDNAMVGPLKTPDMTEVAPDNARERWAKLRNRPVLLWNDKEFVIVPYSPETMRDTAQFEAMLPGVTDVMLAGVWLVHAGQPRTRAEMDVYASKDIEDARRRAAIGVDVGGRFVAAAVPASVSSERFAQALASAGVSEAVLLDSGFSTSLVYDGKIKVSGHSVASQPSRPVPHAIVITGEKDPASIDKVDLGAGASSSEETPRRRKRRRR